MKTARKIVALVLTLAMLFSVAQLSALPTLAETGDAKVVASLPFASVSDIHIFPDSEQGSRGADWIRACRLEAKMFNESETIVRTALETIGKRARDNGIKYVLVPGDLTKDSEYAAHVRLAELLTDMEEQYGLQALVIDGNHDINSSAAVTYKNDRAEPARAITYKEFPEVYANLGYDLLAEGTDMLDPLYDRAKEGIPGSLSYVADLGDDYRLIVVDSCKYSFDETLPQQTDGMITEELMQWIEAWAAKTYADGKVPFMMIHHSLAAHMEVEPSITHAFVLDEYVEAAERIAKAGIHYAYSGHLHINDVASVVNDDGEVLYDVQTDSVIGYPNTYRENVLETLADGKTKLSTQAVDFDDVAQMSFDGVTYDNHTYKNKAFALCFGGGLSKDGYANAADFLMGIVKAFGSGFIVDINEAGGLKTYLKSLNVDLEKIIGDFLKPYIKDGIVIAGKKIFTVDNIMWFVDDLLSQVDTKYLQNLDNLYAILEPAVEKLVAFPVSDVPCTKFMDTLHFGDKNKPGTLGDLILSAMVYWYNGNEDASDDAFVQDAIDGFDNGHTFSDLFYFLVHLVLDDLVEDGLLSGLEIRIGALLGNKVLMKQAGDGLNYLVKVLLRGDASYGNLVKIIFALGVLPYKDLYDLLDQLLFVKYLTPSLLDGIGQFVAFVLNDFTSDVNPQFKGDSNAVYSSDNVAVEATQKNYRLPTMVSVTMGSDESKATISWYSKYSVSGDIEIYESEKAPVFTGTPTTDPTGFTIEQSSELVERQFPGIDLDFFGILWYQFKMNRHTVTLSGLQPDTTYYFRVGNAKYQWWSEMGCVKTADGKNDVTFLHVSDPQSQTARQYEASWKQILASAFDHYPDTDFIVNTGDLVDHGNNNKQWQAMFDTAAPYLTHTYMMPASGNHEGFGVNATANYFVLPNAPQQDTETGVYYSFDYNNVHFAVLNTNDLGEDNALSDAQINWLKADMAKSTAPWKFVMMHKSLYSHGSHYKDKDVVAMREQLGKLMPALGIDLVFAGHDHVYLRTASLNDNKVVPTTYTYLEKDGEIYQTQVQPEGTTYLISGTSGVKFYQPISTDKTDKYFPRAEMMLSLETPMYTAVEIKDKVLYLNAYTVKDGETIKMDSIAIQKDRSQGTPTDYTPQDAQDTVEENRFVAFLKAAGEVMKKILIVVWNIIRIYVLRVEL